MTPETLTVEFSENVAVQIQGEWHSAFQRRSYIARVAFPDGTAVVISLPKGAAQYGTDHYYLRVVANACLMREAGAKTGELNESGSRWRELVAKVPK